MPFQAGPRTATAPSALLALLHAWILFPALLGLTAYGLGLLVERLSGERQPGVLLLPIGLVSLIALCALTTASPGAAKATAPVVAVVAVIGLVVGRKQHRPRLAPALAMLGVILAYGAPVILSGQATFAGYLRLDDTATWLGFSDQILTHGRSLADLPDSTFRQVMLQNLPIGYPLGAFMPLGAASQLSGLDAAWAFAPFLACWGALLAACMYALLEPFGLPGWLRAVVAGLAAQPALLYGYVQWGGIKEITVATGVLLLVVLATRALGLAGSTSPSPARAWPGARSMLPLAVTGAAMMAVVGPGGVAFVAPVVGGLVATWLWRGRRDWRSALRPVIGLVGLTALCTVPTLIALASTLDYGKQFLDAGRDHATLFGNLARPVSGWQLGGVWLTRDFRDVASAFPTAPLLVAVAAAAAAGLWMAVRRHWYGLPLYLALALLGVIGGYLSGASPWLMGKALAIAAPAIPLAALAGAALLASRWRAGLVVVAVLAGGIVTSNVLSYTNVTLAPRDRLAELEHVGTLLADHGPTFDNEYEVYGTRHFLRRSAPVQPAELRSVRLEMTDGRFLIKAASADLDGFPPATLAPYRSLVVQRTPTMSRPSSEWRQIWQGQYYAAYVRANVGTLVRHVPLGDSRSLPYCGNAQNAGPLPLCSVFPVAVPTCRVVERLGAQAAALGASLVASVRPGPVVLRGDDLQWPGRWLHDAAGHSLTMTVPGTARGQFGLAVNATYELWLGGTFARGLQVTIDGESVGDVKDQLAAIGGSVHLATLPLTAGSHRITLTYPKAGLSPGSDDAGDLTNLVSIAFQPTTPAAQTLTVPAAGADSLCGKPLDWVDVVR